MKKSIFFFVLLGAGFFSSCSKEDNFLPYAEQLKIDVATIDGYLTTHNINAVKDSSGLRYVVNFYDSTGAKPTVDSKVYVRQIIRTLSGTLVAYDTLGQVYTVNTLLAAQQTAIMHMTKGSRLTLYVPSGLAYGNSSLSGGFGPNTNMIFDFKLLDDDKQLAKDLAYIDDVVLDTVSNVIKDPSGLRIVVLAPGTGDHPNINSFVYFDYSGKYLKEGTSIGSGTGASSYMYSLIEGFEIGMTYVGVGGHVHLYIPSKLGYGMAGSNPAFPPIIPGNTNLYFDVTLKSF